MLTFPELVLKGFVPHRDFLHLYGPGDLWLLAGVFKVFGVTLASERVVGYLQQVGVAFGIFAVLRWCRGGRATYADRIRRIHAGTRPPISVQSTVRVSPSSSASQAPVR